MCLKEDPQGQILLQGSMFPKVDPQGQLLPQGSMCLVVDL